MKFLAWLLLPALLGLIAAGAALHTYRTAGPLSAPMQVVVPRGGLSVAGEALEREGVVQSARAFTLAAWVTRAEGPIRSAEFAIPAGASLEDVLSILRDGRPVQRRLTIPEGLMARQIATLVERTEALSGETPSLAEGSVLPETYAFAYGDQRAAILRRAEEAMTRALAEVWASRADGLPLASPREALVLASIIERETGKPEERARVAGVFINRLRRGMALQSDPTVAYAAADGAVLDRPLTRADLDRDHPFNTYRNRGLPPGPVASPGRESLRAAVQPEVHDFLYFVADGSGGHVFARTLEEHNRNVARWREVERARPPRP
ncbi:endolytic transglycosylase MltG [Plastoroseomonas arctica]|uniref:endolytic transglycosylase MltG n=1 Tax=Plastoroseomonas arctica TaxID=1509237 RepID=UPI003462A98F